MGSLAAALGRGWAPRLPRMAARRNMDRPTRLTEMLIKAVLSEKDGKSSEYELFMSAKRIAKIENLDKMTQLKLPF